MDSEYLVVLVTVATTEVGMQMGRQLVEERLAACVQVLGGSAIYRWQGELYVDPQAQLIIKTTAFAWERLRSRIIELHSDDVPEVLALGVQDGLPAYLSWMSEAVTAVPPQNVP